jgi:hypothetical protein
MPEVAAAVLAADFTILANTYVSLLTRVKAFGVCIPTSILIEEATQRL